MNNMMIFFSEEFTSLRIYHVPPSVVDTGCFPYFLTANDHIHNALQ